MKEKLFRIKRDWDRPTIMVTFVPDQTPAEQVVRVGYDPQKIYIDTPASDFKERLAEVATSIIVEKHLDRIKKLRYTVTNKGVTDIVKRIVDDVLRDSFETLSLEMKELTRRVV